MVAFLKIVLKTISAYHLSICLASISLHIYRSCERQFTEEEIEKASKYTRDAQFHWKP